MVNYLVSLSLSGWYCPLKNNLVKNIKLRPMCFYLALYNNLFLLVCTCLPITSHTIISTRCLHSCEKLHDLRVGSSLKTNVYYFRVRDYPDTRDHRPRGIYGHWWRRAFYLDGGADYRYWSVRFTSKCRCVCQMAITFTLFRVLLFTFSSSCWPVLDPGLDPCWKRVRRMRDCRPK